MPFDLDIRTAVFTVVLLPLIYLILRWLRRLLSTHLSYVLDYVAWYISRRFHRALATRISLRRYCRLQLEDPSNKMLEVPGREGVTLETDRIFVPLRFESGTGSSREPSLDAAIRKNNRITVVGDPGSGKSSLVKQTFREACRYAQFASRDLRLPIIVELKHFTPPSSVNDEYAAGSWALGELRARIARAQGFNMGQLFESFLHGPGLLVLLDGLDEVASDEYTRTAMAIRGLSTALANQSEKNAIVLTMRVQFHQQVSRNFSTAFPSVYRLSPFTPSDIFSFLERWPFERGRFEQVSRIYADLTDRPTLREMCRNPLVLAMYVANDQASDSQAPPDTRTSFYDQVVGELLVERRSRQLGMAARSVLREQREEILGRLALSNLTDEGQAANSAEWSAAVDIVRDVYRCSKESAEERLVDLERETGIISHERNRESLRFIHLTFCEFLAAKEMAQGRDDGVKDLLAKYKEFQAADHPQLRSRLNEVIPFAVALVPRSRKARAVEEVAAACGQQIIGRCFLETQMYGGEIWTRYVKEEEEHLVDTPAEDWTAEWLERLHLFNVVLQDAERWSRLSGEPVSASLAQVFEGLVGSDRERLIKLFSAYAVNDAAAALRLADACGVDLSAEQPDLVLESCEFPPFIAVVLQRAATIRRSRKRWLELLAEAGLRWDVAAFVLSGQDAPASLKNEAESLPKSAHWSPLPHVPLFSAILRMQDVVLFTEARSAYGVVLTLALRGQREGGDLGALQILKRVRPPGAVVPSRIIRILSVVLMLGLGYLAWSLLHPTTPATIGLCLVGILLLSWPAIRYPSQRAQRYAALVNLSSGYEPWRGPRVADSDGVAATYAKRMLASSHMVTGQVYCRRLNRACREMHKFRSSRHRPPQARNSVTRRAKTVMWAE